jgi:uncharacterized protein DUF4919
MAKPPTFLSVTALALILMSGSTFGADNDDVAYRALVQRVEAGDFTVDFRALRMACVKSTLCEPRGSKADLHLLNDAVSARDSARVIEVGERLINQGFVNIEAHATLVNAYMQMHDAKKSQFHLQVTTALIHSILDSGDGKTKETAYRVISDREEYATLSSLGLPYFGPNVSYAAIKEGGHGYDRFEISGSTAGQNRVVFFNVDAF